MKITKNLVNKLLVCAIIWLLTFLSFASLVQPAGAEEQWTTITLPYTITEAGNYRLTTDLTADAENAILIQANDVVIDGQNYTITAEPDYYGILAQDVSNVTIVNLNMVSGTDGIRMTNANFTTIQNYNSTHATSDGIAITRCANFTISNCTTIESNDSGIDICDSSDFQITSCNSTLAGNTGLYVDTSTNFQITSCYTSNSTDGMYFYDCRESNVTSSTIQNIYSPDSDEGRGIAIDSCKNFNVTTTCFENNTKGIELAAYKSGICYNCTVSSCIFTNSAFSAVYVWGDRNIGCQNITVTGCTFANQSGMAIMGIQVNNLQITDNSIENIGLGGVGVVCTNCTITNNTFGNTGFGTNEGMSHAAIGFSCSNITITDNLFNQNLDAIYWMVETVPFAVDESVCNANIQRNIFQNNTNTFLFGYEFPTSYNYQKIFFSNNLVNDTAYIDPASLQISEANVPINTSVFNFNSTVTLGQRIYDIGPFVGGNYWAHPNGTGPSQVGTDADGNGFIDTPVELFGNETAGTAYDYHPYSSNFNVHQWIDITLPAEIYSPGNYRIVESWRGNTTGLQIFANDVTVDGQNSTITASLFDGASGVYAEGSNINIGNLTTQASFAGIMMMASKVTLQNINTNVTLIGVCLVQSENFTVTNTTIANALVGLVVADSTNFAITNCTISDAISYGMSVSSSENFIVENVTCNNPQNGIGLYLDENSHFQIKNCNLTSGEDGLLGYENAHFTIANCTMNSNGWGTELFYCSNATVQNNQMSNNTQAVFIGGSNNVTFTGNTFSYNGLTEYARAYHGGLEAADSNITVTNNLFESNYDAYLWTAERENVTSNQNVYSNTFRNNNYTFFFLNQLPSNCTAPKLYFYNNFVNDSAYVDPECFNATYSANYLPFNSTIFNFNTTLQTGTRIYGNGPNIGGNYWAYTNGSGPSQTGTDSNHDGFIDTAFDLFNNASIGSAYDYLPLSTGYTAPSSGSSSTSTPTPTPTPTVTPTPTPTPNTIQATKPDNTQATLAISGNITASQYSNITLTTNQTASTTTLAFTVTGEHGTVGFGNITIAKSDIPYGTTIVVYIDGIPATDQGCTEDSQNYYIWFTTSFSTHHVTIEFATQETPPEPQPQSALIWVGLIVAIVLIAAALAILAKRRRRW